MAEVLIGLRTDPQTGKKNVIVKLMDDADALPIEHEQQHRDIVDRLIAGGALKQAELGKIIVDRLPEGVGIDTETDRQGEREGLTSRR